MTDDISSCGTCGAPLAAWEAEKCGCSGPVGMSNAGILYAIACSVTGSLHVRDFVRLADRDFDRRLDIPTANATLAPNRRFCWAGKGLYALYRHGPLPGPRSLEEAARLVLVAAGRPLTTAALDFCLKRLGYRYNVASLGNAIRRSSEIYLQVDGQWDHARGESAEWVLRQQIPIVPPRQRAAWIITRDRLSQQIERALARRASLLQDVGNPSRFGLDWDEEAFGPLSSDGPQPSPSM